MEASLDDVRGCMERISRSGNEVERCYEKQIYHWLLVSIIRLSKVVVRTSPYKYVSDLGDVK